MRRELKAAVAEAAILAERLEGQRVMFTRELKEFAETSRLSIQMLQARVPRHMCATSYVCHVIERLSIQMLTRHRSTQRCSAGRAAA